MAHVLYDTLTGIVESFYQRYCRGLAAAAEITVQNIKKNNRQGMQ